MDWINFFGLVFVVLLLIPNVIYAFKFPQHNNKCQNRFFNLLEQIGRYASMFLMIFDIGIAEFGFSSVSAFVVYILGNTILLFLYWIIWMLYSKKQDAEKMMLLAIIPACMFVLSGIMLGHVLLVISGIIFGIGHIYVTHFNAVDRM